MKLIERARSNRGNTVCWFDYEAGAYAMFINHLQMLKHAFRIQHSLGTGVSQYTSTNKKQTVVCHILNIEELGYQIE